MPTTERDCKPVLDPGKEKAVKAGSGFGIKRDRSELLELINQGYTLEQLKPILNSGLHNTQTEQSLT
ncbi:MAG: hypothetical protein LBD29_00500 [Treponema sp.]|jgi:hypothetical protein|nr:hypothetical protein [Treponema sp.]